MGESVGTPRARIAIDAIPLLGPLTGVGNYIYQLVRLFSVLSPKYEYSYFYGFFTKKILVGGDHIHRLKDLLTKIPILRKSVRGLRGSAARVYPRQFDLYFEPNFIPLAIRAKKTVTTIHDFSFQLFPEAHPKERIEYFRKRFHEDVKRSDRIITVSFYVKTEAIDFLQLPAEVIRPIHLGVAHDIFKIHDRRSLAACKREFGLPENFILFVGTREPRKNLERLLRAYLELPEWVKWEFKLVLVGPRGWGEAISSYTHEKIRDRIVIIDYVSADKLAFLYNLAALFVFPSLYEGFGLPPLEAMACGCPVIVSEVASLPEVCGDAAYYIDPKDVSSIASGIYKVLSDESLKEHLIQKGIDRARLFNWEKTAKETLTVFDEVLENV